MKNQLAKIESTQLEEIVKQSGLEIQEGEQIKQSYLPFLNQLAEIQEQSLKINFVAPTQIDETIARELRLKTVKIRTGSADLKESRKRIHLLKGNLEQAAYNLIAASCKLAEETFLHVEKAREIAETQRKQERQVVRVTELQPLIEFVPTGVDLLNMDDESYSKLLNGAKLQMQLKINTEIQIEAERIAKQKAIDEENERIRIENLQLKKEAEEKERAMEVERKKQADILAKQKAEAEKEKDISDAKLKAEQEEKAKIQSELLAKQKAESEAKAKSDKEEKIRIEAEKKAAKAPDRKKLNIWVNSFSIDEIKVAESESKVIANDITVKFNSFKSWAKNQIENL